MKKKVHFMIFLFVFSAFGINAEIKGEEVIYETGGVNMKGYVAYDASLKGKLPGILVVHEWWGCNEYVKRRARMLAELGYIAFAVDMYGDGKVAQDPKTAGEYAAKFYKNPEMARDRMEAALKKLKEYSQVNVNKIAATGYCFGGSIVLNMAKMGMDFRGVVSFHGNLSGVPATPGTCRAKILVCHGGADQFIKEKDIRDFKQNLDSVKVAYRFISYPGATHAFTNPDATATGKKFNMPIEYSAKADKKSWEDMKMFLKMVFL